MQVPLHLFLISKDQCTFLTLAQCLEKFMISYGFFFFFSGFVAILDGRVNLVPVTFSVLATSGSLSVNLESSCGGVCKDELNESIQTSTSESVKLCV